MQAQVQSRQVLQITSSISTCAQCDSAPAMLTSTPQGAAAALVYHSRSLSFTKGLSYDIGLQSLC